MKVLSVFVDESGDFGEYETHSPYYIVSMVLHDQSFDISDQIDRFNRELDQLGFHGHVVHTEPLIRREEDYRNLSPNERRTLFTKLFYFSMSCSISYKTFLYYKSEYDDLFKLQGRMARDLSSFIRNNLDFFQSFDSVILYYDNGQHQLNSILNTVLATELSGYDARKAFPLDYKLFQVADMLCTLRMLEEKIKENMLSKSDLLIFHNQRTLRKDFIKPIKKKEFGNK